MSRPARIFAWILGSLAALLAIANVTPHPFF